MAERLALTNQIRNGNKHESVPIDNYTIGLDIGNPKGDWQSVALNWNNITIMLLTMDDEMLKKAREVILPITNKEYNTVNSQMAHIMREEAITNQIAMK